MLKKDFDGVKKAVVSLSGGLDSCTLLALAVKELGAENVHAITFDYNQRHKVELHCAKNLTRKLKIVHKIIPLQFLGEIVKDVSAMVEGSVATPRADDLEAGKVVPTYVPFRNSILSSIVLSYAEAVGANAVALGVQFGDYRNSDSYFYWDTSPAFVNKFQELAMLNDKHKIQYIAPFVNLTKADEIKLGLEMSDLVDYTFTWSCYNPIVEVVRVATTEPQGGRNYENRYNYTPCKICPSCVGRFEAFLELGIEDPLIQISNIDPRGL